ncbi:PilN domain-containing protein [Gilvimarinus sp. SDUM040013]|uniref:PilN domain-containing protein n=1 Tax=Gilvimarinus gilvus TaxID=3058038 RepID=A0ABU4RWG5_9GAMM|nr:PilN domain-containing protein [Gilvimarinus sp. SDUM040013]MDO3385242.1 PilN domain-containing protein [Gilvimarinus sp. SDUM040013]MDX6849225.1 PilN domain-containing protein [Gilvimarinus sp. SDUM040013]
MATNSHQWVLFGVDLKGMWQEYIAAWREVFWQQGARIRSLLDEPVELLELKQGEVVSQSIGSGAADTQACALLLPQELVLDRQIRLPRSAHANLSQVVAAEVIASSPFAPEDTATGWQVMENTGSVIVVALVIVSTSAVMEYVHGTPALGDDPLEIWAQVGSQYVVIEGFAETQRNKRYSGRLKKLAVMCACIALAFLVVCITPVFYKLQQLAYVEEAYSEVRLEAGEIASLRGSLAKKNKLIDDLNGLLQSDVQPLQALNLLTYLLADDVWLSDYSQRGSVVEIQGTAVNAAAMMQYLSQQPYFEKVRATSGFRKIGNRDLERFQIELTFSSLEEKK